MENDNPYATPQSTGEVPAGYLTLGYPRRRMRFWRIEQLKAEMRDQPLSDRESLPYLVWYVALFTAVSGLPTVGFNALDLAGNAVSVVIAIVGTIHIYRQNGGIDGQHFLQRYFAIGFVVGLRCFAAILAAAVALIAVLESFGVLPDETTWYELVFVAFAGVLVYWRIGIHVGDLSRSVTRT